MSISIKTKEEIEVLRKGGKCLAQILKEITDAARPGVATFDLDRLAESLIFESGGKPAFKGYRTEGVKTPYPASLCTSINDEVVHAIPRRDRILKKGDIVGLDIGMQFDGLYTDMAVTIGAGKISNEAEQLLRVTKEALGLGIGAIMPGIHVGDISNTIAKHLKKYNYGIIRDLAGHGVGYELHEEPLIPNYGKTGTGPELKEGMVLAIEPMAALGDWRVVLKDDEWTFATADGSLAAHFEHTVVVTQGGAEVLTVLAD